MKVAFRPRRLGHANLFVSDLDRSLGFYGSVCGLEFVRRERALDIAFLSNGSTHHDVGLVQVRTGTRIGRDGYQQPSTGRGAQPGLNHLGFEMENEAALVDAYQRCAEAGVEVVATTDHLISRSVYLHDPDGHMLEFYSDSLPDWRTIFNPEREDLVSGAWTPGAEPPSTRHNYAVAPEIRRVADAPLHPSRMRHALLAVRDLERSRRFYRDVAGLEEGEAAAGDVVELRGSAGDVAVALVAAGPDRPAGVGHFAFEVPDETELAASAARLREQGITPELTRAGRDGPGLFITDPDGFRLKFFTPRRRAA
jgi:catechol 2,3-dioxygenase